MWNQSAITETGKAILAQAVAGNTLVIDRAESGTETVSADALHTCTEVAGVSKTVSITKYVLTDNAVTFTVQFTSATTAYVAKQIGIFGHTGTDDPGLIAIYQDENGISIPSTADMPDFLQQFYGTIQVNNIGAISVNIDPTALVSRKQMAEMIEQEMPTIVTSWLDDHVDPETGYVIDDSLTIAGAAADAKKVGSLKDEIVKIGIDTHALYLGDSYEWQTTGSGAYPTGFCTGFYSQATGEAGSNSHRLRSVGSILYPKNAMYLVGDAPDGYGIDILEYDDEGSFIRAYGGAINSGSQRVTQHVEVRITKGHVYKATLGYWSQSLSDSSITQMMVDAFIVTFVCNPTQKMAEDTGILNRSVSGGVTDARELFAWENGTYNSITVGGTLKKYDGGNFLATRKRLATLSVDIPFTVVIKMNDGYLINVYGIEGDQIISAHNGLIEATLYGGRRYALILKAENGTDDISDLEPSDMLSAVFFSLIDAVNDVRERVYPIPITGEIAFVDGHSISSLNGTYNESAYYAATPDYIDIRGCTRIAYSRLYIKIDSLVRTGMAFYDESFTYIGGVGAGINASVTHYEMYVDDVPEGAAYARFSFLKSTSAARKDEFALYDADQYEASLERRVEYLESISGLVKALDLHETPLSIGVLNVIKRCRQMTDIRWTPAVDLPRLMMVQRGWPLPDSANEEEYEGVFKAGVEYKGIPYGRCNRVMRGYDYQYSFVGCQINFDTFISSVVNPNSKLCQESAFNLSNHETTIYAAVCSALTCYALNVDYRPTANISNIPGLNLVGKINDNGVLLNEDQFLLGDCLNLAGYHTAMITDIIRDKDGHISVIELSDASTAGLADKGYADGQTGGICRRKGWTIDQIYNNWGEYSVLRYDYIDNVPYTPSRYVNVGDEIDMWRIEHFPCMPYEGEGFAYHTGSIPDSAIRIVLSDVEYGYLRVFKDGTEIEASPIAIEDGVGAVDVNETGEGSYSAYLCNIDNGNVTNLSYPCHWTVE